MFNQEQREITASTGQVLVSDNGNLLYMKGSGAQVLTCPVVRRLDGASPGFTVDVYNAGPENLTIVPRAGQTVQGGRGSDRGLAEGRAPDPGPRRRGLDRDRVLI